MSRALHKVGRQLWGDANPYPDPDENPPAEQRSMMTTVAVLVHAVSVAIFTLGILITLAAGPDVTNAHIAATIALLGLNVAIHYLRSATTTDSPRAEQRPRRRKRNQRSEEQSE